MTDDDDDGWIGIVAHNRLIHLSMTFEYTLNSEVINWLFYNVSPNWKSKMVWNEFVSDDGDEIDVIGWYTVYFKNERDAILFKLRWS